MRRIQLFEFTDQPWYPRAFRRIQTDYLQFVVSRGAGHENLIPLFRKALEHAGTREIVDLCSGGTGPWLRLQEQLRESGLPVTVHLTDKYPYPEAMQQWSVAARQGIEYLVEPVDATHVSAHLRGMRTLSRFLFTYLIPLVPLATIWDGMVSFLRVYSQEELKELVASLQSQDYTWEVGQASTGTPLFVFTYLVGYPS